MRFEWPAGGLRMKLNQVFDAHEVRGRVFSASRRTSIRTTVALALCSIGAFTYVAWQPTSAQTGPVVFDSNLAVRAVVSGLSSPVSLAFLNEHAFLVVEKATGQVKHVVDGVVSGTVLDLAVNNASERGLLSITLHPAFPATPYVYLYWTCRAPAGPDDFTPSQIECPDEPQTGADSGILAEVPLRGNRVDRFVWTGSALTFDRNLIKLRSFQFDETNGVARGNHNGGVVRFGADGMLYVVIGDNGRRGQLQNLVDGPFGPGIPDDQFGGPEPDDAHLTGVILRLEDDGSTPADNPFFAAGSAIGGEAGANIQKIYAYGVRNSFGLAVDPISGSLWDQQNGDDSFDEINRVEAGSNLGWVQIMGPVSRIAEFKAIEIALPANPPAAGLQQVRWPPTNIADTPAQALSRLFMIAGAHYSDPEFSWKYAVAPAGIGFLKGSGLGPQYAGDLFVGAARPTLDNGYLFHFNLTGNRRKIAVDDPRLADRVADNTAKFDATESESLRFGTGFGVGTDIETSPSGTLYVVSLSNGVVYEIYRK
jgi:glucose/arabinose dehydrogenase